MAKTLLYQAVAAVVFVPTAATAVAPQTYSSEVIFRRSIIYQSQAYTPFVPTVSAAVVVPTNWNGPPPQRKRILYQSKAYAPFTPETITVDKWFEPWSDPTRRKRLVPAPDYISGYLPNPSAIPEGWIPGWRDPVRSKPGLRASLQQSYTSGYLPDPSAVPEGWIPSLSDPVRLKPGLRASLQQSYTSGYVPDPANLPEGWISPLSEPKRFKRAVAQQSDLAWSGFTPAIEIITEDKWHQPWSEPKRFKKTVAQQQDLAWSGFTPIFTGTGVGPETHSSEVLFPRSIVYQSLAYAPFTQTEVVTLDKWYEPWSEPKRVRRQTSSPVTTANHNPIVSFSWFEPLPELRRRKPFINYQISYSPFVTPTEVITEDKWHQPWSEPLRAKRRPNQGPFAAATPIIPNASIMLYGPFSEPVRFKRGLRASFQQVLAFPSQPPPAITVTFTMSAFEINADKFFAAIGTSQPAVFARVSVHEIAAISGAAASIEET